VDGSAPRSGDASREMGCTSSKADAAAAAEKANAADPKSNAADPKAALKKKESAETVPKEVGPITTEPPVKGQTDDGTPAGEVPASEVATKEQRKVPPGSPQNEATNPGEVKPQGADKPSGESGAEHKDIVGEAILIEAEISKANIPTKSKDIGGQNGNKSSVGPTLLPSTTDKDAESKATTKEETQNLSEEDSTSKVGKAFAAVVAAEQRALASTKQSIAVAEEKITTFVTTSENKFSHWAVPTAEEIRERAKAEKEEAEKAAREKAAKEKALAEEQAKRAAEKKDAPPSALKKVLDFVVPPPPPEDEDEDGTSPKSKDSFASWLLPPKTEIKAGSTSGSRPSTPLSTPRSTSSRHSGSHGEPKPVLINPIGQDLKGILQSLRGKGGSDSGGSNVPAVF